MEVTYIHLKAVTSTNTWAKENHTHFDLNKLTRITASEQTQGRGRFNRSWISPKDVNLYVTYFFTNRKNGADLNNLSQLLCLSIVRMLHHQKLSPQIKWPNDVQVHGKKIAGILCEVIDLHDKHGVIIGAGINVNMSKEDLDIIDQPATSILKETGEVLPLDPLLKLLDQFFIDDLTLYQAEGFKPFYKSYDSLLTHKGQPITLRQNGDALTGTLHSLNPDGRLNLLLDSGEIKTVSTGEIKK
ncbi:MAG: biotin--[acetyl-CoA-carboxylase] ligase [Chlamydiia bacterium]|nr:biotin--[acetyl-CoA-carboxylase] ligase [Chlamydiia bacterium]